MVIGLEGFDPKIGPSVLPLLGQHVGVAIIGPLRKLVGRTDGGRQGGGRKEPRKLGQPTLLLFVVLAFIVLRCGELIRWGRGLAWGWGRPIRNCREELLSRGALRLWNTPELRRREGGRAAAGSSGAAGCSYCKGN